MKRLSKREQKRIQTTKQRHGSDVYSRGGKKMWANIKRQLGQVS